MTANNTKRLSERTLRMASIDELAIVEPALVTPVFRPDERVHRAILHRSPEIAPVGLEHVCWGNPRRAGNPAPMVGDMSRFGHARVPSSLALDVDADVRAPSRVHLTGSYSSRPTRPLVRPGSPVTRKPTRRPC